MSDPLISAVLRQDAGELCRHLLIWGHPLDTWCAH